MVRYGDVFSLSVYLRIADGGGSMGVGVVVDVCCVVAPEAAVALASTVAVPFAAPANAAVGLLHISRRIVQLRSEAPVVIIAWLHVSFKQV